MGLLATGPEGIAGPDGAGALEAGAGERIGEPYPRFSSISRTTSSRFLLSAMTLTLWVSGMKWNGR